MSSEHVRRATTLADALRLRFEADGDPAVLDEAIALAQAAIDATPRRRPQRAIWLVSLSLVLRARRVRLVPARC